MQRLLVPRLVTAALDNTAANVRVWARELRGRCARTSRGTQNPRGHPTQSHRVVCLIEQAKTGGDESLGCFEAQLLLSSVGGRPTG